MSIDASIFMNEVCALCGKDIGHNDAYCRHCGAKKGQGVRWYHKTWGIIILLFLVLGPLAIPLLWRSPVIPRERKLLLTMLCLAFTSLLGWMLIQTYLGIINEITGSMNHYRKL